MKSIINNKKSILVIFLVVAILLITTVVIYQYSPKQTTSTSSSWPGQDDQPLSKASGVIGAEDPESRDVLVQKASERLANPDSQVSITVDEGKLVDSPSIIKVNKDASVRVDIIVKHDEARLSLEGYDIITESSPEAPGAFSFIAEKVGTFTFYYLPEKDEDSNSNSAQPTYLGQIIVE